MATFYFTYGLGDDTKQAYQGGGWTEVEAETSYQAVEMYKEWHPPINGFLPCCGVAYSRENMLKPLRFCGGRSMLEEGNGGKFCRERITARGVEVIG